MTEKTLTRRQQQSKAVEASPDHVAVNSGISQEGCKWSELAGPSTVEELDSWLGQRIEEAYESEVDSVLRRRMNMPG